MNKNVMSFLKNYLLESDTPCLYYNLDKIKEDFKYFNANKNENIKLLFPVKSFSHKFFLDEISEYLDGFDISNNTEYESIESYNKEYISCSSPFICEEINEKVIHDVNSEDQKPHKKYYIRLNLNESSRFGIDLNSITKELLVGSKGIHFHNQKWGEDAFEKIRGIIKHFEDNFELEENFHFNIGGGYNHISQNELLGELNKLAKEKSKYIFFIEPGRMFIKNNGYLIGKVLEVQNIESIKETRVLTNISHTCHLRWELQGSGINFYSLLAKGKENKYKSISIGGSTVYEHDKICSLEIENKIYVNDFMCINMISGYGMSWNSTFNGIDKANLKYKLNNKIILY